MPSLQKTWITLYVLELEHGCFYVGQSATPEVRVAIHKKGKGSAWTKAHAPVRLLERRPAESKNWKDAEEIENHLTLMMMRTHGWQRVRGGYWTNVSEELTRKNLLHHQRLDELAVSRPLDAIAEEAGQAVAQLRVSSDADQDRPPRSNQVWGQAEDKLLQHEYHDGQSIDVIARKHGRTPVAIAARLVRIGLIEHRRDAKRASEKVFSK